MESMRSPGPRSLRAAGRRRLRASLKRLLGRLLLFALLAAGPAVSAPVQAANQDPPAPGAELEALIEEMEAAAQELDRLRAEVVHELAPEVEQTLVEAEEYAVYVRVKRRGGEPLSIEEVRAAIDAIERAQEALRGERTAASLSGIEREPAGRGAPAPAADRSGADAAVELEAEAPSDLVVPSGTRFLIRLRTTIDSAGSLSGDPFTAASVDPVTVGDVLAIPSGTLIVGHIAEVTKPGRVQGRARLVLAFDHIYPYDRKLPLVASFSRGDPEQKNTAESESGAADDVKQVVVQAAIPAAIGAIFGGAGGAARGAIAGAAIGSAVVLATPGLDVLLPEGSLLWIQLEEHLRF